MTEVSHQDSLVRLQLVPVECPHSPSQSPSWLTLAPTPVPSEIQIKQKTSSSLCRQVS